MHKFISLIGLVALSTMVACNGKSSSSKKCTINDVEVSCDQLNTSGAKEMNTKVKVDINLDDRYLEILESATDEKTSIVDGIQYYCSANASTVIYDFQMYQDRLYLTHGSTQYIFEKVPGSNPERWTTQEQQGNVIMMTTLVFLGNQLEIQVKCKIQ